VKLLLASKAVASTVALFTLVACQSDHTTVNSSPGSASTRPQVFRYPQDPVRKAAVGDRFVATYTVDDGAITIDPPPAGPPDMSKRAAINRFHLLGLLGVHRCSPHTAQSR
jgi:hypothetical protein